MAPHHVADRDEIGGAAAGGVDDCRRFAEVVGAEEARGDDRERGGGDIAGVGEGVDRAAGDEEGRARPDVVRRALDVSGGYGYKRGPLERAYRDARAAIGMGPSNNIAREWIGKTLVGLPLELFEAGGE